MSGTRSMWQFLTVASNVCAFSVSYLVRVTILVSRILSCPVGFWKVRATLALVSCFNETRQVIGLSASELLDNKVFGLKKDKAIERR